MKKRYLGLIAIWIAAVLIFATTYSFFPGIIRERGDLYTTTEQSQMLLTDSDYKNLEIEYDYVEGYGPSGPARDQLLMVINKYCEKDVVKDRLDDEIKIEDSKNFYSEEDIYDLNEEYRDVTRHRETAVIHVMFLNGIWKDDKNVLGLSYGGDKIVIFKQAVMSISQKSMNLEITDVEKSVIVHEFGHLISLVGINYDSEHEVNNNHCSQEAGSCVMASSVEVNIGRFSERPPTDLCELCQEDLEKIKNAENNIGLEELITYVSIISEFGIFLGISFSLLPERRYEKAYLKNVSVEKDDTSTYHDDYYPNNPGGYEKNSPDEEDYY